MYSSLDRIDIVTGDDENPVYVQTDHRTADEIEAEREISTIFALTKVLAPMRHNEKATVCYAPMHDLPEFFEDVLGAVGAEIHRIENDERRPAARIGTATAAELADRAFSALATLVRKRDGLSDGEAGLVELEDDIGERGLDPENDETEIEYWTAVVELAAVTGELLRAEHQGEWVEDEPKAATIPFLFRFGANWLNPTGKAQKFIAYGESDRPSHLLAVAREGHDAAAGDDGPILCAFKPAQWADQVVCTPMLENSVPNTPPLPVVAYGRDYPNTFAYYHRDAENSEDVETLRSQALANLADVEVEVAPIEVGDDLKIVSVSGSFFASEKVLDRQFMRVLHGELEADLLAAGIPKKGLLLVTSALQSPELIGGFARICEHEFESDPSGALYPLPLLVSDGEVVGIAVPTASEPEPEPEPDTPTNGESKGQKPGLFRRLFGGSKD